MVEIPVKEFDAYITIDVKVKPKSRSYRWRIDGGEFRIWLISSASKGKANKELITRIAELFKIPPNDIRIIKGFKSRSKTIRIDSIKKSNIEEMLE